MPGTTNEHPHVTVTEVDNRKVATPPPAAEPEKPAKKPRASKAESIDAGLDPMHDLFALHRELRETGFIKEAKGSTGNREYKYQDLPALMAQVGPILDKHNFVWYSRPSTKDGQPSLKYRLVHISGWVDEDEMFLMAKALTPQDQGGAITYARRYSLSAQLGIVADEDDDAAKAQQAVVLSTKKLKEAGQAGRKRETAIYTTIKRISAIEVGKGRDALNVEDYEARLKKPVVDLTVAEADSEIARMSAYIMRNEVSKPAAVASGQA